MTTERVLRGLAFELLVKRTDGTCSQMAQRVLQAMVEDGMATLEDVQAAVDFVKKDLEAKGLAKPERLIVLPGETR